MAGSFVPISSVERVEVRDDFYQDPSRIPRLWEQLCSRIKTYDPSEGKAVSSYQLNSIEGGLVEGGLPSWAPGEQPPQALNKDGNPVTVGKLSDSVHTRPDAVAKRWKFTSRLKRFRSQGPRHLDMCHRELDRLLKAFLLGSTFNGKDLSGSSVLASLDASLNVMEDIESHIYADKLRLYRDLDPSRLKMVAVIDVETARLIAQLPEYSGRSIRGSSLGAGSGTVRGGTTGKSFMMPMSEFQQVYAEVHDLEEVIIAKGVYSSARAGQTPTLAYVHDQLWWHGVVDRGNYDLTDEAEDGADGSVAICLSDNGNDDAEGGSEAGSMGPYLRTWTDDGAGVEYTGAAVNAKFINPRNSSDSLNWGFRINADQIRS